MVDAARQGGGAAGVDNAKGTTELPLPWTWLWDVGLGSPPWMRPQGRQRVAAVVEDAERGGMGAALDEAAGTAELPLPLTWTPVVDRGHSCEQGRGDRRGVPTMADAVG